MNDVPIPDLGRFRPASKADFTRYARDLGSMLGLPLQAAQQLLAKLYGYGDLHELKASLALPGEPGPYEDRIVLEPLDCLDGVFDDEYGSAAPRELLQILDGRLLQRTQRIWSLLVEECSLKRRAPAASPAHALVAAAGFFSSPGAHRAAMSRVNDALSRPSPDDFGLDDANWPWARLALRTSAAFALACIGQVDVASINKEAPDRAGHRDSTGFDPAAEAFEVVAEQAAKLLARYVEGDLSIRDQPRHPWVSILLKRFDPENLYDGPPPAAALLLGGEDYLGTEELLPLLKAGYEAAPDHEIDPEAADRWFEELESFCENPTDDLARSHALLKCIPDAVRFVEEWRDTCFVERVRHSRLARKEVYFFEVPSDGRRRERCVVISLTESSDCSNGEFDPLHYYEYGALICERPSANKAWKAFGAVHGMHIEIANGDMIGDTDLMWGLDAHSAMLNDVWKVLHHQVAPERGHSSFTRMLYEDIESDQHGVSVVTAHLLKSRRGKGELAPMLDLFAEGMRYGDMISELCTPVCPEIDRFDDELMEELQDLYPRRLNSPFLLVCPIEGSRPASQTLYPSQVLLVSSPAKVKVREADKDAVAEQRREALTEHFEALDLTSVELVVYNPWDYPIT